MTMQNITLTPKKILMAPSERNPAMTRSRLVTVWSPGLSGICSPICSKTRTTTSLGLTATASESAADSATPPTRS